MAYHKTGVLLLAFGGPETLDEVAPFMKRLMGRAPAPELLERVKQRYQLIGGGSPLPGIVRQQAEALEGDLGGDEFRAYVGLHYSHPLTAETVEEMAGHGIERAVAISMSPHSSRVSSAAYVEEVRRATAATANAPSFLFVEDWHTEAGYLDAVAEKVEAALETFDPPQRAGVQVIFSAHSLPKSFVDEGDPYVGQLNESVAGVVERLGGVSWHLAYQSKGRGEGEWLGPQVGEVLERLASDGARAVLVVPIGFTCDHVETLYDIDISMRGSAESLGLVFRRAESLNTSPKFIDALTHVVRERLRAV